MPQTRDRFAELHARIVAGDPVATNDLFCTILGPLTRVVFGKRRALLVTWEDAADLATDAIVDYIENPSQFDPDRATLLTFLALIAQKDLIDLVRSRSRRRELMSEFVELERAQSNNDADDTMEAQLEAEQIITKHVGQLVTNPEERRVLTLMLQGEKDTSAYAEALCIVDQSQTEQRRAVKSCKDRLEKRLQRLGERLRVE